MPKDYGGENSSVENICIEYEKVIDDHREYFRRNAECGFDEKLRMEEGDYTEKSEFGIGGSFRKINVD